MSQDLASQKIKTDASLISVNEELKKLSENSAQERSHQVQQLNVKLDKLQIQFANLGSEMLKKPAQLDSTTHLLLQDDLKMQQVQFESNVKAQMAI